MRFRTAQAIADCIRDFMNGACGSYDWDDFTSVPLKDPELEALRRDADLIPLPADEEGKARLRQLLDRATVLASNSRTLPAARQ